jgi:hypothetical protein
MMSPEAASSEKSQTMNRILLLLPLVIVPLGLLAQDNSASSRKSGAVSRDQRPPMAVTPERESAVMTFIERNHPALKDVLASLKTSRPKEYEKAIRDIYLTSERLASIKERDSKLYDLELRNWTLRSQIQLLTAQMVMAGRDEIRAELRKLLNEQMDVRGEILRLEQERVKERLSRIESDLVKMKSDREQHVEKQLDQLMRSAQQSRPKAKLTAKPEKRPGAKKNKATVNESSNTKTNPSNQP